MFENVRVPRWYIIGDEGAGFMYQMIQFQEERMNVAAIGTNRIFVYFICSNRGNIEVVHFNSCDNSNK